MIIDLPDTTTGALNRKLVELRESGGAIALSRVLTLVIVTEDGQSELSIQAANDASREHPCRVICLVRGTRRGSNRLDAQIRVGGDAGASEVIVLRLYGPLAEHGDSVVIPLLLPDAPTVAWWPGTAPDVPAQDPIGAMAQRRITDAAMSAKPARALEQRSRTHAPGDTDLAWSRITLWRGLLAAWLALYLQCPVRRVRTRVGSGLTGVHLDRASGPVDLVRPDGKVAALTQPGQPERRIALAPRADRDCLTEELRRLDPDDVYGAVVTKGMALLAMQAAAKKTTAQKAAAQNPPAQKTPSKKTRARKAPAAKGAGGAAAST
jgi:glucose-6-phosphate dehydrogenase assembly protein OpcA